MLSSATQSQVLLHDACDSAAWQPVKGSRQRMKLELTVAALSRSKQRIHAQRALPKSIWPCAMARLLKAANSKAIHSIWLLRSAIMTAQQVSKVNSS